MKSPSSRRLTVALLAAGTLLAGCSTPTAESSPDAESSSTASAAAETGGSCDVTVTGASPEASASADPEASTEALEGVNLSSGADAAPTVSFEAPLAVTAEAVRIVDEGSGEQLADGQLITFNYLVCDAVTGEKVHSTWGATADADAPESYLLSTSNFGKTLTAAFESVKAGSRIVWAQPGVSAEQSSTGAASNGYVYVMSVTGAQNIADSATGTAVTPTDATLPVIEMVDGKPAMTVPAGFTDPTELVVQPLIDGEGAEVTPGQNVVVKYTGWLTDGTQFDSSWDRDAPDNVLMFQAGAGGVIQGWDEGLVGQKVGSRVLLVVPSAMGYGSEGSGDTIPADATLIFVVDILAAA